MCKGNIVIWGHVPEWVDTVFWWRHRIVGILWTIYACDPIMVYLEGQVVKR